MFKHIVMMKLKQADESVFKERLMKLEKMLNKLKTQIPSLVALEVGLNISKRPTAYDIVIVSEFIDEKELDKYRVHPKHIIVLDYIKEVVAEAKVVDYLS
ncbi:MAG: Dabb family protein [Bacteroidales bacterium]|nr:Dabb family protein [Bacteroidales bacterium]